MFVIDFSLINVNSGIILVSGMHIDLVNFKSTFLHENVYNSNFVN